MPPKKTSGKTAAKSTAAALKTDAPGSCQPVPPVVAGDVIAPFADANAAIAQCTAGHTMRAAVDSLREHLTATAPSTTAEASHDLAKSLDNESGKMTAKKAASKKKPAKKHGRDDDDDDGADTTTGLFQNIKSVADEVIEARRSAAAELRYRQPLILAAQRLKELPTEQSGFKPTDEQVAALDFFLKDIRYVKAISHRATPKYDEWTYDIVEATFSGLRIHSCYAHSATSSSDSSTDVKFAKVDATTADLSTCGVYWHEGKELTGHAVHKALLKSSPLKALSPQTLELLCKVATCTLGIEEYAEWSEAPYSENPLVAGLFTGYQE